MVGDIGMRHARIWCQLEDQNASETPSVSILDSVGNLMHSVPMNSLNLGNCFAVEVTHLNPGTTYRYFVADAEGRAISDTLHIQTQPLWQYRTDPPQLNFLLGSCTYINETEFDRPGDPYGGDYEIFQSMAAESFDAMLWLGDNIYLREVDFFSLSGYVHRYSHARALPEMQGLISKGAHYAIWDDHDFGPNDCDGSWVHSDWALRAFKAFWPNPEAANRGAEELNVSAFAFGDVEFFLLDNRTHRINHEMGAGHRQLLGEAQRKWLLNALSNSRAPFKFIAVGGQMLSDAAIFENFAQFPEERDLLFSEINRLDIRGVVFLTGDRHNSELTQMQLPNGRYIYDLTVSPLTSGSYDHESEPNTLRVPGTMVGNRNYGKLEITGPRKERVLTISVKNTQGETVWSRSIGAANNYQLAEGA